MSKYERLEPVFVELDSGDEHIHPIFNTDFESEVEAPRRKTPFLVIGSLLILAFAGGGLVFAYKQGVREGNRTAPPIIKASARPIKTAPVKPGGIKIPNQNKRVYDRLDKKPVKVTERLMPSAEEIMDLPKKPQVNSGIIIENPPVAIGNFGAANPPEGRLVDAGSVKVLKLPGVVAAPARTLSEKTAPLPTHEVDVFTITPDGVFPGAPSAVSDAPARVAETATTRIRASESVAAPEPAPAPPMPIETAPQQPVSPETISKPPIQIGELPEMVDGKTLTERLLEAENALAKSSRGGAAGEKTATTSRTVETALMKNSSRLSPGSNPAGTAMSVTDTPVRVAALPPVPRRKPVRRLAPLPVQPALAQPARTRPAAPEKKTQTAVSGRGRFVVQIASHRRQVDALAEFAGLKRRHPDIVGNYKPSIQRADLGDRGIYYRLRIGPLASKAEAASFCETLKTAGKNDCLIRRR